MYLELLIVVQPAFKLVINIFKYALGFVFINIQTEFRFVDGRAFDSVFIPFNLHFKS
jgi:hypothetical protein